MNAVAESLELVQEFKKCREAEFRIETCTTMREVSNVNVMQASVKVS